MPASRKRPDLRAVWELYQLRLPLLAEDLPVRYNVVPTQKVAAVRTNPDAGEHQAALLRLGLIRFWCMDEKCGQKLINARGEAAVSKPAFHAALKRRHCVIPASGFFEWETAGKKKQPTTSSAKTACRSP